MTDGIALSPEVDVRENWADSGWDESFEGDVRENWGNSGWDEGFEGDVRENWAESGWDEGFDVRCPGKLGGFRMGRGF